MFKSYKGNFFQFVFMNIVLDTVPVPVSTATFAILSSVAVSISSVFHKSQNVTITYIFSCTLGIRK